MVPTTEANQRTLHQLLDLESPLSAYTPLRFLHAKTHMEVGVDRIMASIASSLHLDLELCVKMLKHIHMNMKVSSASEAAALCSFLFCFRALEFEGGVIYRRA